MSQEQNLSDLKKKTEEAWAALLHQQYEVIEPRFYRVKKGRKLEPIHPWKDMDERVAAENKYKTMYDVWLKLYQMYFELTGERVPVPFLYKKELTPEGERWKQVGN